METKTIGNSAELLKKNATTVLKDWLDAQRSLSGVRTDLITEKELHIQSSEFLALFTTALNQKNLDATIDLNTSEFKAVLDFLTTLSSGRAVMGFTATETATFILSLKQPLFSLLTQTFSNNTQTLSQFLWNFTLLIDKLALYTTEQFQKSRERIIKQQQQELLELSTPVTKLWDGVLMLPLIGTLDSSRTQLVMENLLQKIVDTGSTVAIIDITGIPTVDTLVAQHLIKTTNAARLMGAECIISGIRPQIAQTIIHLGISLNEVTTKATLADALNLAFRKAGYVVSRPAQTVS